MPVISECSTWEEAVRVLNENQVKLESRLGAMRLINAWLRKRLEEDSGFDMEKFARGASRLAAEIEQQGHEDLASAVRSEAVLSELESELVNFPEGNKR